MVKPFIIRLLNAEGKILARRNASGLTTENFNLNGVKSGIYFVNIFHANGVETIKVVKE